MTSRVGGCPEGAINDNKCNDIQIEAMQCDYLISLTKPNLHINDKSYPYKDGLYQLPGIRQMAVVAS